MLDGHHNQSPRRAAIYSAGLDLLSGNPQWVTVSAPTCRRPLLAWFLLMVRFLLVTDSGWSERSFLASALQPSPQGCVPSPLVLKQNQLLMSDDMAGSLKLRCSVWLFLLFRHQSQKKWQLPTGSLHLLPLPHSYGMLEEKTSWESQWCDLWPSCKDSLFIKGNLVVLTTHLWEIVVWLVLTRADSNLLQQTNRYSHCQILIKFIVSCLKVQVRNRRVQTLFGSWGLSKNKSK